MFLLCTTLYKWLSIFFWIFVMHISVRITIHVLLDFRHAHDCTNDYPYCSCVGFLVHISVRMHILSLMGFRHAHLCTNDYPYSFCMGFRHAHFCTNDYPFLFEWVSVMHISVRITTISFEWVFVNAHFCTNDYHFFFKRFSSCTFLYEWLPFHLRLAYIKPNFLTTS